MKSRCDEAPEGDFVECGVYKGGYSLLMSQYPRDLWMFDSWDGIPLDRDHEHSHGYAVKGPREPDVFPACIETFHRLGLLRDRLYFMKGWFEDTLPRYAGNIAVLVLDGDLYASTRTALEVLYPKVVSGGFVVIDDMDLPGCRDAVMEYRKKMNVSATIYSPHNAPVEMEPGRRLRHAAGAWWRK